jgi:hypothetical protein
VILPPLRSADGRCFALHVVLALKWFEALLRGLCSSHGLVVVVVWVDVGATRSWNPKAVQSRLVQSARNICVLVSSF